MRTGFLLSLALMAACARSDEGTVVTIAGSVVGREGELLARQVARFEQANPGIDVRIQQTPDDATQRHQLFVQWLNAHHGSPDVLQLDLVWTAEFAAAGWILGLDRFGPDLADFFPSTLVANRWSGELFAVPWFVDVGMLYWRKDLIDSAPTTFEQLHAEAKRRKLPYGFVWQGARYEGLITVFAEFLGGVGGEILRPDGEVAVDSPAGIRAATLMREQIESGVAPAVVLAWHEEETRFAFQNGRALFLRNWPYAYALLQNASESAVAGRVAIAPMPASASGRPTASLGGAQLAINAFTRHPRRAWALIAFLTAPDQMLERAELLGQYPARRALFSDPRLDQALDLSAANIRTIIEAATPRPVTPIYTQLSEVLQIHLHRALTGQAVPESAMRAAATEMRAIIERTGVGKLPGHE